MTTQATVGGVGWVASDRPGVLWETAERDETGALGVIVNTGQPDFREFVGSWWTEEMSGDNPVALLCWVDGNLRVEGFLHAAAAMKHYSEACQEVAP